ncbi:SPOR domain-containing protein [Sulfurimonas microaerophilic]|uniref:SPOR domain-containing protein n=1 Tax=Sulfurimonas microaerophilic TaxID=3058392 RepID=UPI002714C538|nr:SPOR domain-containing protein [Sulfurimonas sp. hsl 1-7]
MNENNELSDIVLNKSSSSGSSKKMVLAIATLGIILIAVVTIMKSCGSDNINGTPQTVIPPKPQQNIVEEEIQSANAPEQTTRNDEPLFEEVEVIEDDSVDDADLDKIAQKLKEESQEENVVQPQVKPTVQTQPVKTVVKPAPKPVTQKVTNTAAYYIQVGSFTKYEPNQKFLQSITKLGYQYMYHKVRVNNKTLNKVLVGPFTTEQEARDARRVLRSKVEPGAFLVKLK